MRTLAPLPLAAILLLACTPPAALPDAADAKGDDAKADDAEGANAKADDAKADDSSADDTKAGAQEGDASDVGEDPPWFNADIIENTQVLRNDRSSPHQDGTVSASLQLELPDEQTIEGCISALKAKIEPGLQSLGEPMEGEGGRIEYRGKGPGYAVSFLCGHGKDGKLNAFIGVHFEG